MVVIYHSYTKSTPSQHRKYPVHRFLCVIKVYTQSFFEDQAFQQDFPKLEIFSSVPFYPPNKAQPYEFRGRK